LYDGIRQTANGQRQVDLKQMMGISIWLGLPLYWSAPLLLSNHMMVMDGGEEQNRIK
jgi:hypothetical protein